METFLKISIYCVLDVYSTRFWEPYYYGLFNCKLRLKRITPPLGHAIYFRAFHLKIGNRFYKSKRKQEYINRD